MEATKCPLIQGKAREEEIQTCLNCPLPQCVLEIPGSCPAKEVRNIQIIELARQGKPKEELANIFNVSKRTIQRTIDYETVD